MAVLTVIANFHARADQIDRMRGEMEKLVPVSRGETGCLQYDLFQDNWDPAHFTFVEQWASRELWMQHIKSPHVVAFGDVAAGAIAEFNIQEMTQLG